MQRILFFSFLILSFISCRKESGNSFIWDKSYGPGTAYYVSSATDSGIVSCGELNGSPFLTKLSGDKVPVVEYTSFRSGLFNRAWYDTSLFVAAGSSEGSMLLEGISKSGNRLWDTAITAGFKIDYTRLCYKGSGELLAIGTAKADTAAQDAKGLLIIELDTTGRILARNELPFAQYIAAGDPVIDGSGNIYIPVTRKISGAKLRASVLKYDKNLNMLWLTDLYNNSSFASSAAAATIDNAGFIYICGATEVSSSSGSVENSYTAALRPTGALKWKKYLEDSNAGTSLLIDGSGIINSLGRNCFLIDRIKWDMVKDTVMTEGPVRWFNTCDPYNTDAFGSSFDIDSEGNIIAAGTLGGKFYIAVKSGSQ